MKKVGNILWGLVLIVVGIIIGLNVLEITHINLFFNGWWTLFIIVPCFIGLIIENDKVGNLIGLIIGIVLLLCARGIMDFGITLKLLLPIALIIIGLSLMFRNVFDKTIVEKMKNLNSNINKDNEYCAMFSTQNVRLNNQKFSGAKLTSIFGQVDLDLRESIIKKDVVINVNAIFGGSDIFVPENVNIVVKSTPIFGGITDKSLKKIGDNPQTIYINAICIFGGINIK